MSVRHGRQTRPLLVFGGIVAIVGGAHTWAAQQPPPIQGVTGTIATEGTIQETDEAAHKLLVKTADGIERLFHWGGRSAVHGDTAADETLRTLTKGTRVVVHYTGEGDNLTAEEVDRLGDKGLKHIEGKVTAVNRSKRTISIKLASGTTTNGAPKRRAAASNGAGFSSATLLSCCRNTGVMDARAALRMDLSVKASRSV